MPSCPYCGYAKSNSSVFCGGCGKSSILHPIEGDQRLALPSKTNIVERNAVIACCGLSLILFFFPLLTIQIPIAGQQDVSGYDAFSKLSEFREKLDSAGSEPRTSHKETHGDSSTPEIPLTVKLAWIIPIEIVIVFIMALAGIVLAFKDVRESAILCLTGAIASGIAVIHITVINSDVHTWLANSMKTTQSELKNNPFAGLAENLGTLILNSFQIKPGWGLYALLLLLGLGTAIGFSGILSRLRVTVDG